MARPPTQDCVIAIMAASIRVSMVVLFRATGRAVARRAVLGILVDEHNARRLEGACQSRSDRASQKRLIGSVALASANSGCLGAIAVVRTFGRTSSAKGLRLGSFRNITIAGHFNMQYDLKTIAYNSSLYRLYLPCDCIVVEPSVVGLE